MQQVSRVRQELLDFSAEVRLGIIIQSMPHSEWCYCGFVIVRPLSTVGYTSVAASVIHSRQCMV